MTVHPFSFTEHAPGVKIPVRLHRYYDAVQVDTYVGYVTFDEPSTVGDNVEYGYTITADLTAVPQYEMIINSKSTTLQPLSRIDQLIADEAAKDWEL